MSDSRKLDAHLFVCTNKREKGDSCGAKGSEQLRESLKAICQKPEKHWHGRVRVNASGCLGRCKEGIVAVMYPKGEWMTNLTNDDVAKVEQEISKVLD